MNDLEALETAAKAIGDQTAAVLRDWRSDLDRIAKTDPTMWTLTDIKMIKGTLLSVVGFIHEGRL